jgi:hypothetical protein
MHGKKNVVVVNRVVLGFTEVELFLDFDLFFYFF